MRSIFPTLALCFALATAASVEAPSNEGLSLRTAEDAKIEGLPIVDLEVIDDRIEGRVFTGTFESAVAEMKAFRPELFAREVEGDDEPKDDDAGLDKRAGAPVKCNWGGRIGSWNQCIDGMVSLGRAGDKWCVVKPSSCARVSCSYNCGMFLCNKRKKTQRVRCREIPDHINAIGEKCRNVFGQINGRRDFRKYFIGLGKQKC